MLCANVRPFLFFFLYELKCPASIARTLYKQKDKQLYKLDKFISNSLKNTQPHIILGYAMSAGELNKKIIKNYCVYLSFSHHIHLFACHRFIQDNASVADVRRIIKTI